MSDVKETILNLFSATIESIGESKLVDLLQQLHDKSPIEYQAAISGGRVLIAALLPLVTKTKTSLDDAILGALDEAIKTSAEKNKPV